MNKLIALLAALATSAAIGAPDAAPAKDPHAAHKAHANAIAEPVDAPATDSVYNLEGVWTDSAGKQVKLSRFKGQPVVLAMIYSSCQAICPLIVGEMKQLEREAGADVAAKTHFVVVSFDPARDTPARLAQYAKERELDPARWTLLTGNDLDVRELAAVLGFRYRPSGNGDYVHSNLITALDSEGVIKERLVGLGQDHTAMVAAVKRLARPVAAVKK